VESFLVVSHQNGMLAVKQSDDDQLRDGQQPRLDQNQPTREVFGIGDVEVGRVVRAGQRKGWVAICAEGAVGVESDPPVPAQHTDIEVEQRARIAAGEQDGEASDHGGD
jgi:hypothetical protein